jgi:hypothetical protein
MDNPTSATRREYPRIEAPVTPEIERALQRYLEIQRQHQELQREKDELQQILARHLERAPDGMWYPVVGGTPVKVRYNRETVVEYNEPVLRERLGERYVHVVRPDPRKIRSHLAALEPLLAPAMAQIGTPDRDRVRAAVEQGLVRTEEFAGAFRKQTRARLAVMRMQPPGAGAESAWDGDATDMER